VTLLLGEINGIRTTGEIRNEINIHLFAINEGEYKVYNRNISLIITTLTVINNAAYIRVI
jgi:hypothetical protein